MWTYLPYGPFERQEQVTQLIDAFESAPDVQPYAASIGGRVLGFLTVMRIQPEHGTLELGAITFGSGLRRTTASTESIYLLMAHAFRSGYRRVEWKCDSLNEPSLSAAARLGFTYEGTFMKATHYKGRNRDTAWFAIVDDDWPEIDRRIKAWLNVSNFDESGTQLTRLRDGSARPSA